ncbi:MAG: aspartate aminotransferase family protein [Burkholderiales bacterium]|nr:aspartate aminotransferase family protein [Burkholderiales bacterium]
MSRIIHRSLNHDYPRAVAGDGPYLIDSSGRRYIDASSGAAVSCLGHSDREVIAAIKDQLDRLPYAHTSFFSTEPAELLAEDLVAHAPRGLEHVYFCSGGSEAVEAAIKFARQYAVDSGQAGRDILIARRQSYHGSTLGALSAGGRASNRRGFEPLLAPVRHVAPCYDYRERRADETEEGYARRLAAEFEAAIEAAGPQRVFAFIAETVSGATLGATTPPPGYFKLIRDICDRHGILLILDEVMCGMGRTGTLWACEQEGVVPDIACIAKSLGAGYQPIGATLCNARVIEAVRRGSGAFAHSHTYIGHPAACAGALAVQRVVRERGLVAQVRARGDYFERALRERFADHPHIGDIRGRGLFRGVELVADRAGKATFDPALKLHARLKAAAMAEGMLCYPMGGAADGTRGDHVLLAPPFIVSEAQLDEIVDKLARALDAVLRAAG